MAAMAMRIYQPMMFVGLGGTGCKVGAELERRMREDLCGPSGTNLQEQIRGKEYLPFQLPACVQFVYADLSAGELDRVRHQVVPGREHDVAARRTMHLITDLVPPHLGNSAAVAQSLRLHLDDDSICWLPPKRTDPKVGPLLKGAGQLPTVGRAVLFETLRTDLNNAVRGIETALQRINQSGPDLYLVSRHKTSEVNQVNVFVVFSVAGGTGSGIFYDYLHLIGDVLRDGVRSFQIFPLVLMPSAFEIGQGGGRPAQLNAGSALIDLFRLIDDQNAHGSDELVGETDSDGNLAVRFPPPKGRVSLSANTVPTAFLFSKPKGGLDRDNLGRSMVALMLSLIGAGSTDEDADDSGPAKTNVSFMDRFINGAVERNAPAGTGIGRRGVSTSAVAELTTPVLEIADIVSSHLLAAAVDQLRVPPGPAEQNRSHIERFGVDAGLQRLLEAAPTPITSVTGIKGFDKVMKALGDRDSAMAQEMNALPGALAEPVARLARDGFVPRRAAFEQLRRIDLFRLHRVAFGDSQLTSELDQGGFRAVLYACGRPLQLPAGYNPAAPPQPQGLSKRILTSLRWDDESVKRARDEQDTWYAWRAQQEWYGAWGASRQLWERVWREFEDEVKKITEPFLTHAQDEPEQFKRRSIDLYRKRVGVSYLLPPQDRGMEGFYADVVASLKQHYGAALSPNAQEGEILNAILVAESAEGWAAAYIAGQKEPADAFAYVRQAVRKVVSDRLRPADPDETPLVPHMSDVLARAANKPGRKVSDADLNEFRQKLAGLVPGGFPPQGDGNLRILFTYPAAKQDSDLEQFLESQVELPKDRRGGLEFRDIYADSMVVVLMRSEMGITEVPEVRAVIDLWSKATRREQPGDSLGWRRRLEQDSDYLLMSADDREHILQRLLCVAWNGRLEAPDFEENSPRRVLVRLASDGSGMDFELSPLGGLSSWATLLQAYERWILGSDDLVRRTLANNLMQAQPMDLLTNLQPPAPMYETIVALAEDQLAEIKRMRDNPVLREDPQMRVFEDFWSVVLPAALARPIGTTTKTLRNLGEATRR
jgi:Tubulin like